MQPLLCVLQVTLRRSRMRPWLLAALIARCASLRPQTRFGAADYGDEGWQFKKRYAVLGAAAAATSVRPVRRARGSRPACSASVARTQRVASRARPMEDVHEATAIKMERLVRDLRGAYVKSAQLISTAFPELLPAPWVSRLEVLVDDAPARPWRVTKRVLERELGRPISELFRHFELEPVGAASIGQVHRATTLDNRTVAVKVMYPGGRQLVLSDLSNVRRVLRIVKPALLPAVDEFRMRVKGEFDYRKEAAQMDACGRYLRSKRPRLARRIAVPASLPELSSRKVLTMAWLSGRSLRSDLEERLYKAQRSNALVKGWRLWRLQRRAITSLKRVAAAQGALIFGEDSPGFSADPHPGNVMVLEDGRLGLIDYGCSCCYDQEEVAVLADLYHHLHHNNRGGVVDAVQAMGFSSKRMDEDYINTFATQLFDRNIVDGGLLSLERLRAAARREGPKDPAQVHAHVPRVALVAGAGRARRRAGAVDGVFVAARGGAGAAALYCM